MKERNGFVTNSSSSSFIIGKREEEKITIESVYQTLKSFFKEYLQKKNELMNYIEAKPKLGIEYRVDKNGYGEFTFKSGKKWDEKNDQINKELKRTFGLDTWDYFHPDEYYAWTECETYADYEKYWNEKLRDKNKHAPFTIIDFIDVRSVNWLHFGNAYNEQITVIDSSSDTLGWYFAMVEYAFENPDNCKNCSYKKHCKEYPKLKESCLDTKKMIKKENIPEDHACLYMLGRVCVESESGYIPGYIVNKLREISTFSCDHMG